MSKKRKRENNAGRLIRALGMTLSEFARTLGVSASAIKKVVEGKRTISDDLRSRIFAETGILFFSTPEETPMEFSKEEVEEHRREIGMSEKQARFAANNIIGKSIELMMIAAARPGVGKSFPVFTALNLAVEKVKNEFHMEKHIDAVLRERSSTESKLYTVRELRGNHLLAEQTGFKDDPALKDDDKIPLTRAVGWIPTKEIFNIMWQQREFICELLKNPDGELDEATKVRLEAMAAQVEKQVDDAISAAYPTLR